MHNPGRLQDGSAPRQVAAPLDPAPAYQVHRPPQNLLQFILHIDVVEQAPLRIRREGGGRKPSHELIPELAGAFLQVLEDHTAGSPMNAAVKWTNLTHQEIAEHLAADHGIAVSVTVVKRLLRQHDFVRRKAQKRQRTGECAHRDAQFAKITRLKEEYTTRGAPIVSIDTKKKS